MAREPDSRSTVLWHICNLVPQKCIFMTILLHKITNMSKLQGESNTKDWAPMELMQWHCRIFVALATGTLYMELPHHKQRAKFVSTWMNTLCSFQVSIRLGMVKIMNGCECHGVIASAHVTSSFVFERFPLRGPSRMTEAWTKSKVWNWF